MRTQITPVHGRHQRGQIAARGSRSAHRELVQRLGGVPQRLPGSIPSARRHQAPSRASSALVTVDQLKRVCGAPSPPPASAPHGARRPPVFSRRSVVSRPTAGGRPTACARCSLSQLPRPPWPTRLPPRDSTVQSSLPVRRCGATQTSSESALPLVTTFEAVANRTSSESAQPIMTAFESVVPLRWPSSPREPEPEVR